MDFTHKENEIVLLSEEGALLAQITFPYKGEDRNTVEIDHTFVDASLRGQGIAGKLMKEVVNELETRNLKAVPTCSYAAGWFEKHPEYAHLLK
ncbi:MAG TPA: N-acetyltransferase [Candidatus Mediterraneibacter norwichensis]|nr:N-acetyltransferase [Candidatus Mediterraneibacter norwichensis]